MWRTRPSASTLRVVTVVQKGSSLGQDRDMAMAYKKRDSGTDGKYHVPAAPRERGSGQNEGEGGH